VTIAVDLTGLVALVTGGTRGVGRGITDRLRDAGAIVVTCGRSSPEPGVRLASISCRPTSATPSR